MAVPNLTANSPVSGSIAWSAFSIQYGGVGYSVAAGSTPNTYVWWVYNNGAPTLQAGNTLPTLTADDILLFINKSGVPVNVPASTVVEGSLVVDGSIVGKSLAVDAISSREIDADAINAKHTITGAVVQTSATANRGVKIVDEGLIAYDAAGNPTLSVNAATGAITMKGALTSGSSVTGATVTGGTVQTETTAARGIKMTSAGLIGYNASGVAKFTLTPTGGLTLDGPVTTGGSLTGATVTGGTVQTVTTAARGIKMVNNKLIAYDASGNETLTVDGATGSVAMKGTLTSGSTITGATISGGLVETVAANGSKAILQSGSLQMFSNMAGEVATGGVTAGSWTWNGVAAAQTIVASPRVSGNGAAELKLWQGNNGKAGAQLKATDSVKLTVDDTFQVVHAEAPKVHLSAAGGAKNTEVRIATSVLALDADQVWVGNKVVDFRNPVNWRWMDYMQPATACPPDGAWRQPYARTWIPWASGASYAHIAFDIKANTDTAAATDSYWQLITWSDGPLGATPQTQIAIGYAHNGGGTAVLNMGAHLSGWMNAPARGYDGQYLHVAVNQRVTGTGWVAGRACTLTITFFS